MSDPWDPILDRFKAEPGDDNTTLLVKVGILTVLGFWVALVARLVLFVHHPHGGRTAIDDLMWGGLAGGALFAVVLAVCAVLARRT